MRQRMFRAALLAGVLAVGCSTPAEPAVSAPTGPAASAPTEPAGASVPGTLVDGDPRLEAAQYALVAHPLTLEDPDIGVLVAARCTLIAIDLGLSAELRASGRLPEALGVRDQALARARELAHIEPLLVGSPVLRSVIESGPETLRSDFPSERARAASHVAELAERAFRDESRVSAPTIEVTLQAVEAYVRPIYAEK